MTYDLHSDFNIEQHKKTFIHYLEVVIDENGKIMYAVPSHQEMMIKLSCKKLNVTREELNAMCPEEYYFSFMTWICKISGACAVWERFIKADRLTEQQVKALQMLKDNGLYLGEIPRTEVEQMYRNILFMAKQNNGEWAEGYLVKFGKVYWVYEGKVDKFNCYKNGYGVSVYPSIKYLVVEETICQYTGFLDKNKRKIFENHIIKSDDGKIGQVQWFEEHGAFMIWDNTDNKIYFLYDNDFSKIEVIGNIFDNPELLKEDAQNANPAN